MARALVTVMFTDIVGSTELRSRVGDDVADGIVAHRPGNLSEHCSSAGLGCSVPKLSLMALLGCETAERHWCMWTRRRGYTLSL